MPTSFDEYVAAVLRRQQIPVDTQVTSLAERVRQALADQSKASSPTTPQPPASTPHMSLDQAIQQYAMRQ